MTAINPVVDLAFEDRIAVLTISSPPVNALGAPVRAGIVDGLKAALAANAAAIVLICAGRTFCAGADISEFGKPPVPPSLADAIAAMEASPVPVVAAIHGTALGGGLELALGAHYRVAVPSAKLGLPEIKLGIFPGGGGTQRLPRLTGIATALDMILTGAPIDAETALSRGILDRITGPASLRADAVAFAREISDCRPLPRARDREDRIAADRGKPELFEAARKAHARKYRGFEAWLKAIEAVQGAVDLPFDEGLANERRLFEGLLNGTQAKAQRYAFFAERAAAKIGDIPADTPVLPVKSVGIIGAGTMGGGIAMNFLNAGIPVTIVETSGAALDRGLATIRANYEATARKGRLSAAEVEARMGRLAGTLDFGALKDADLVIEAVFENMALKKEIFGKLDAVARPGAILASNTSYLDIDEIAAATGRPEHVLGLHFFSPANVMRLLEVVRGQRTAKPVIATAMALARTIGKVAVLTGVCHGFVGNRMLAARQREARKLILEGAMPWDADRVLTDFGLPMGPFAMSDLAGLDIGWSAETSNPAEIRDALCAMGRRGQKTKAGYYDYDDKRNATPSAVVEAVILAASERAGIARRAIPDAEILERLVYPMINEGAKILEEGIVARASDIDVVWLNGYGWPIYRGGPMFHANTVGLSAILARLKALEAERGADFKPAALLERLVAEGKGFAL